MAFQGCEGGGQELQEMTISGAVYRNVENNFWIDTTLDVSYFNEAFIQNTEASTAIAGRALVIYLDGVQTTTINRAQSATIDISNASTMKISKTDTQTFAHYSGILRR